MMKALTVGKFPRLALLAGGILLTLAIWVTMANLVQANPATVGVGSGTVAPGGSITVPVNITPTGSEVVAGALIDVTYPSSLAVTACTPVATCNPGYGPNTVRLALANLSGLSGQVGSITFQAGATPGTANLGVAVPQCFDAAPLPITCTGAGGTITIQAPAAPAPEATTPAPTTPPAGLPVTGSASGDGDGNSWLLPLIIGLGAAALMGSSAFAINRARNR